MLVGKGSGLFTYTKMDLKRKKTELNRHYLSVEAIIRLFDRVSVYERS